MFITRTHLSRRTVLRGLGATLALPLLDSMVPALTALGKTAAAPIRRLGVFYVPNGMSLAEALELRQRDPAAYQERSLDAIAPCRMLYLSLRSWIGRKKRCAY